MLTREQLIRLSREEDAPDVGIFEKDYVISCLLDGLSQVEMLGDTLIFKGGTALRKVYFPDWRYSDDLDFSVLPPFDQNRFRELLEDGLEATYQGYGVSFTLKSFHRPDGMVRLRVQYRGPLQHPNLIYLDITFDERIVAVPERRAVRALFPACPTPEILVYPLEEILAEKLCSLIIRGKSRDYYDVWRLLKEKQDLIDLGWGKEIFLGKCEHRGITFERTDQFVLPERLLEARPYWDRDLRREDDRLPEFEQAIGEIRELVKAFG